MASLSIPREREIKGPWLIGIAELRELDSVIETISKNFSNELESELSETSHTEFEGKEDYQKLEENSKNLWKSKKRVTLFCKDGKMLTDVSIKGILKHAQLKDLSPTQILIKIQSRNAINLLFNISTIEDGSLAYNLMGANEEVLDEAKYHLDQWIEKHQPRKLLQLWSRDSLLSFLFGVAVFFLGLSLFPEKAETVMKGELKQQAREIIKQGVTDGNREKAIEILLKLQTEYVPDHYSVKWRNPTSQETRNFVIACVLFIFSLIKPKTILGVGKNKPMHAFYTFWTKFVLITLPATLLIPYIVELARSFLYR